MSGGKAFVEADEEAMDALAPEGEADRALLRAVLDHPDHDRELGPEAVAAFEGMLDDLNARRWPKLTDKQRAWVRKVADRLDVYVPGDGARPLAPEIPRGREVETPAVLRDLPKRPPGSRSTAGYGRGYADPEPGVVRREDELHADSDLFDDIPHERDWGDLP